MGQFGLPSAPLLQMHLREGFHVSHPADDMTHDKPTDELTDEFNDELDEERTDARARSTSVARQKKWWIIGAVGVLVMSLLAGWFAISASGGVGYSQAGFKVESDSSVKVIWDVHTPEKKPVTCTLITLNDKRDVLGTKVVNLPVSKYESTRYTQHVKTVSRAVTGTVQECHYTGERAPRQ